LYIMEGIPTNEKHCICMTINEHMCSLDFGAADVFRLLKTLPNLTDLHLNQYYAVLQLPDVALFVQITQHPCCKTFHSQWNMVLPLIVCQ
jgi:hypothetical protein